jgi:NAD(P)-dependent dehydrogenase (short-subunit alcohol dehydrogenase family)
MLVNMSEAEWDAVLQVHLRGTFGPSRHAAAYWRERAKGGGPVDARIINTTSPSGLFGNPGQTNYGAAKAGIAGFTIIAAQELARYGVTVNAVAPTALTRMTEDLEFVRGMAEQGRTGDWHPLAPENISPLVVWLGSTAAAQVTGRVFTVMGGLVAVAEGWVNGPSVSRAGPWTPAELGEVLPGLVSRAAPNADMLGNRPAAG